MTMEQTKLPAYVWGLSILQTVCSVFLIAEVTHELYAHGFPRQDAVGHLGLPPMPEYWIKTLVILALSVSIFIMTWTLHRTFAHKCHATQRLQLVTSGFFEIVRRHFDEWDLTPSERDVALLTIKGVGISEIAELRGTQPGTIKAQCASIYRKAGVEGGRAQLLSLFIEEMIHMDLAEHMKLCPKAIAARARKLFES